jgi:hypothetical protein
MRSEALLLTAKLGRKLLRRQRSSHKQDIDLQIDVRGQAASDLIKNLLTSDNPCMISRIGSVELNTTLAYLDLKENLGVRMTRFMRGEINDLWWSDNVRLAMSNNAGFFPTDDVSLDHFAERMINDMRNIDVLGSWLPGEMRLSKFLQKATKTTLADLEPYYHDNPWSEALKGRKVLVIHPFSQSIQSQYSNRELLFRDSRVLPDFHLVTLPAVQSIAGETGGFSTWFEALDWMCREIDKIDYEIALIGAGAYGLPLASYIKSQGRKAVHLGGATQILFGIRGQRWDENPFFQGLYNEHWVRPSQTETPQNSQRVESGCYW